MDFFRSSASRNLRLVSSSGAFADSRVVSVLPSDAMTEA
jgi:hypothetical protein